MPTPNMHLIAIVNHNNVRSHYQTTIMCWDKVPDWRAPLDWKIPENVSYLSIKDLFRLPFIIRNYDIVLFHGAYQAFPFQFISLILASLIKKRVYLSGEGLKHSYSSLKKYIFKTLLNRNSICYLAIGNKAKDDYYNMGLNRWAYRKFCFAEEYPMLFPEIDVSSKKNEIIRILTVSRLIAYKQVEMQLEALSEYNGAQQVELHIAGSGELMEKLKQKAEELNIAGKTFFHGHCDKIDLHKLYLNASIFVLASNYEGWGVVVNQAVHYGLPLLINESVRSGKNNLVKHGENGFLFKDKAEMIYYLKILCENAELREKFRKKNAEINAIWNIEEVASRLTAVFQNEEVNFTEGPLMKI